MTKIEIRILKKTTRHAVEINSVNAGRQYTVDEIELGVGTHRKAIKYAPGFLKENAECRAVIIGEDKLRIVG